ncbi:hypothetical protein NDU88_008560, partial [Pleurodeles waltl]
VSFLNVSSVRSLSSAEAAKNSGTMADSTRPNPHSVKRWQLESMGLSTGESEMIINDPSIINQTNVGDHTKFSAWTPIANQSFNKQ